MSWIIPDGEPKSTARPKARKIGCVSGLCYNKQIKKQAEEVTLRLSFNRFYRVLPALVLAVSMALSTTGCIAAALLGGAAGGYVVAKHIEDDKKLREKKEAGDKNWFDKLGKEKED
jgi:hypothetical protein